MNIKFTIDKTIEDKPYNPEFVKKIRESEEDFKNGRFTRVKKEDLKNYIDNL